MLRKLLRRSVFLALALAGCGVAPAENLDLMDDDSLVVTPDNLVYCTVCHGVQMMGNQKIDAPRLSGMDAWYIEQALGAFQKGWRGTHADDLVGMEMRPMATALSADEVVEAARYVSNTRSPGPVATIDGDAVAGKTLYTSCAACHGANGEGNQMLGAPALNGLNDWYLVRQLENYRNNVRGTDPADTYGAQMRASVALLGNDKAIADVVSYISTLPES